MDQLRKRLGRRSISYEELEDELEYNFRRKEDLKKDLENLQEENEELKEVFMKNAETHIESNNENKKLKEEIENLKKEIASNEDDQLELCLLKTKIKYLKEENVDNEKKLKTVNESLLIRMKSILKCDECDKSFKDKASMITHCMSKHTESKFNCDDCEKQFEEKSALISHILSEHMNDRFKCDACEDKFSSMVDLNMHVHNEHTNANTRDSLLKRQVELMAKIRDQKIKIYNKLYYLKQKETKQNGKCYCKGNYCSIDHATFRWNISKADVIFRNLSSSLSTNDANKVSETDKEDSADKHLKTNNQTLSNFACDQCDKNFEEEGEKKKF